jgi:ferritin-like metal-binding protein YciE
MIWPGDRRIAWMYLAAISSVLNSKAPYSADEQIFETLPRMIQAAANAQLAAAFQAHLEQTKVQANRLEKLLERHNQSTRGSRDKAMEGVLADSAKLLKGQSDQRVRDLGLIAAALEDAEHRAP